MICVNYGKIGLEHFIHTYGIILSEKSLPVNLLYGCSAVENKDSCFNIIVANSSKLYDFEDLVYQGLKISNSKSTLDFPSIVSNIPFISYGKDHININIDIFYFIGRCLGGDLESYWKNISKPEREKLGKVPFIDVYERVLFLVILYAFEKLELPFVCKSFWPGNRFAVCLTHDVDEVKKTYQWVTRPLTYLKNMQARLLKGQLYSLWYKLHGKEPFWTFNEVIKIEERLNVRSSFYFLKEKSKVRILSPGTWKLLGRRYDFNDPQVREVMKQLCCGGWEVGLHGSYDSYYNLEMLEKEKNNLQISLGDKITGIRQHHLHLDNPKTWEYHEQVGLQYDTTLGFKDQMGFKGGTCLPFHPLSGQKRLNLIEIPLAIMDTPFFKYKKNELHNNFEEMVNIVSEFNGVLTLLWHHAVFNEYEYPGWSTAYRRIIELCKKKNAWITGAKELSDWWRLREKTSFDWEYEGTCLRITPYTKESNHFLNVYLPENMVAKKILNAEVIEADEEALTIRTDILKDHECVKIELQGSEYGN